MYNTGLAEKARKLVAQMTLEEKASLCSGKDFWERKAVEWLVLRSVMLTDWPYGLRKQTEASDHLLPACLGHVMQL